MAQKPMRSPLAQASGLGSAKEGVEHWWHERLTAVALIPLTLWFIVSMMTYAGSDYAAIVVWLRNPGVTVAMTLLLLALFHHSALGLQVIVEDYIHSGLKFALLAAVRLCCFALAITGIIAVLKIALEA